MAFQVDEYKTLNGSDVSTLESNFIEYFGLIMNGALVPVIVRPNSLNDWLYLTPESGMTPVAANAPYLRPFIPPS